MDENTKPDDIDYLVLAVILGCMAYTGYRFFKGVETTVARVGRKILQSKKTTN